MPGPLYDVITNIETNEGKHLEKIYMTPRGQVLEQYQLETFSLNKNDYILICGHYEGIDQRIIEMFDIREVSI